MTVAQDTTITVTLMRPVTLTLPRTLTEHISPQLVDDALDAFVSRAADAPGALYYSQDDLAVIAAATLEGSAVCVRYEHDDEVTARVLFPSAIFLTKDDHICVRAYCTYRRETKCFRVDRMACVHSVTMPGEIVTPRTQRTEAEYWAEQEATGKGFIVSGGRHMALND